MFFLLKKNTHTKIKEFFSKETTKQNSRTKAKQIKSTKNITTESILCLRTELLLDLELSLDCGWWSQWHFLGEDWLPLSQKVSVANCFLAGVGLRVHFPFPVQQFCLVCICVRLVHVLTVPEFTCLSALLWLEDSFSEESSLLSGSYSLSISFSAQISEQRVDKDIPFRDEFSKVSLSTHYPVITFNSDLNTRSTSTTVAQTLRE